MPINLFNHFVNLTLLMKMQVNDFHIFLKIIRWRIKFCLHFLFVHWVPYFWSSKNSKIRYNNIVLLDNFVWKNNIFKGYISIGNWITMTRKSGEHLRTTYGNTGQLFRAFCSCWFDLQWGRSWYALLMRPNKVETAVQCFRMLHASVCLIFWSW